VTREFGTALGVALLGAVLSAGYKSSIDSRLDGVPTHVADIARESLANAVAAADGAGSQPGLVAKVSGCGYHDYIREQQLRRRCHEAYRLEVAHDPHAGRERLA
jgi:hypothetical protein